MGEDEEEEEQDKKLYPCFKCGCDMDDEYLFDGICETCIENAAAKGSVIKYDPMDGYYLEESTSKP
jgi:poly-beta-hydroxyalkanoate depolymerase